MTAAHRADSSHAWRAMGVGGALLLAMLVPAARQWSESSMTVHMLVQYPCLLLAGGLLVSGLPMRCLRTVRRFNELGIAGLVGAAITLAVLMVPRVLDLALVDPGVELLKVAALVLTGAALRLSWRPAGLVVQVFFLGNVLPMMAVVGTLYQDATTRVCNAYRLDDQQGLGSALVWIAIGVAVLWALNAGLQRRRPGSAMRFAHSPDASP